MNLCVLDIAVISVVLQEYYHLMHKSSSHLHIDLSSAYIFVMLIGSKAQLKSLNVDDFILSHDDTPLELVENAKYLGMFINCDISWDFHVRRLCQSTYYHISLLRRLCRTFPMNLLLQVYISYIQPRSDYGITLYGCSTQKHIDLVQRVQNHAAMLIMGNFDCINCRGIDLVKSLNLYTIRESRDHFLTTLMFKAINVLSFGSL